MLRQALRRGDRVADLQLPHDAQLLAEPVLVERLEIDDVGELGRRLVGRAAGQALRLDVGHRPRRAANLDDLSRLGHRRPHT